MSKLLLSLCLSLLVCQNHVYSVHIIVNNDGGSDDAIAMMLSLDAIKSADVMNNIESLTVTGVDGNTGLENVTRNYFITLKEFGNLKEPRPYEGASHPLHGEGEKTLFFGADGLGDTAELFLPVEGEPHDTPAVLKIVELIRNNPKNVIYIELGPLTNLALAHRKEPNLFDLLHSLYILGGSTDVGPDGKRNIIDLCLEFNFAYDQEAAVRVLEAATCPTYVLTLAEDSPNGFPRELFIALSNVPTRRGRFFNLTTATFFVNPLVPPNNMLFMDPLMMAAYFYPKTVITQRTEHFTIHGPCDHKCNHRKIKHTVKLTLLDVIDMPLMTSILLKVLRGK